MSFELIS
ncbi:hypothetical protein RDI58_000607 [Solanum bulbocastanum]